MGAKKPKTQTVTRTPFFQQQSMALANRVTDNALDNPAFRGSTHAGLTRGHKRDIRNLRSEARAGDPQFEAAQELNNQTLSGAFLGPNPHLSAALAPIREEFQRTIAPSIDAAAVGAGRSGSGRHAQMQDTAQQQLADTMGRVAYQNYSDERGRQQHALSAAPGLSAARFHDNQIALGAHGMLQANRQGKLDDKARRFYEAQQAPISALGIVGKTGSASSQPIHQGSRLGGAIGGGLGGAGAGAQLGGMVGGPAGAGIGAAIGGGVGVLGGLFG